MSYHIYIHLPTHPLPPPTRLVLLPHLALRCALRRAQVQLAQVAGHPLQRAHRRALLLLAPLAWGWGEGWGEGEDG